MRGPGKYDAICTFVREHTGSRGCLIVLVGGDQGDGMSLQATPAITAMLPELLRRVATDIENEQQQQETTK